MTVLRRVVMARTASCLAVPLSLEYRTADPVAIGMTVEYGRHRWYLARTLLDATIRGDTSPSDEHRCVATVHVSPLPGGRHVALVFRCEQRRWPLAVATNDLADFLQATYQLCPAQREAQLVADELDMHCHIFYAAHGQEGNPA